MARYAKANISIDDLKEKIQSYSSNCSDIYDVIEGSEMVKKDIRKINVDFENADYASEYELPGCEDLEDYEMIGDFPIAWGSCGGDWEHPIIFVLYIGEDGTLRAYVPSKGNAYDHKEKCAYGSEEDEDAIAKYEEMDDGDYYVFNVEEMRNDIKNRIVVRT